MTKVFARTGALVYANTNASVPRFRERLDKCLQAGLAFVHQDLYDVADLYKTETSWPAAFQAISQDDDDDGTLTREILKKRVEDSRLLEPGFDLS